jgi:hypothetical protein
MSESDGPAAAPGEDQDLGASAGPPAPAESAPAETPGAEAKSAPTESAPTETASAGPIAAEAGAAEILAGEPVPAHSDAAEVRPQRAAAPPVEAPFSDLILRWLEDGDRLGEAPSGTSATEAEMDVDGPGDPAAIRRPAARPRWSALTRAAMAGARRHRPAVAAAGLTLLMAIGIASRPPQAAPKPKSAPTALQSAPPARIASSTSGAASIGSRQEAPALSSTLERRQRHAAAPGAKRPRPQRARKVALSRQRFRHTPVVARFPRSPQ